MIQFPNQQNSLKQEIQNNPNLNGKMNNTIQELQRSNNIFTNLKSSTEKQTQSQLRILNDNQQVNQNTLNKQPSQQITRQQLNLQTQPQFQSQRQNQLVQIGNQVQLPQSSQQQQYLNKNIQSQSECFSSKQNFQNQEIQQRNPQLGQQQIKNLAMCQDQLKFNQNHVTQNGILSDGKQQQQTFNNNFLESQQNKIQLSNSFHNNNSFETQKRSQIQYKYTSILEEKREGKLDISNQPLQNEQDILMSRPQIKQKNMSIHQSNVPQSTKIEQPQNQETQIDQELFKRQVSKGSIFKDDFSLMQAQNSNSNQVNFYSQAPQKQKEQQNLDNFDIFNLSVLRTSKLTCYYCTNYIKEDSFGLNCLHNYHQDCLKEIILRQLQQGYGICSCICNKQIKQIQIIKILEGFGKNFKEQFFQNQVDLIKKNYKHKIPQY